MILGFVNAFKPAGPTSVQVGARVRRAFARVTGELPPIGHLGTLDPMAAGVLPLAIGKATRLLPLIEDRRKSYVFTLVLGSATASGDATGATIERAPVPRAAAERLAQAASDAIGPMLQVPPMVSALHHNGERLYVIARRGETVERPPRRVTIYALELLGVAAGVARLRVACSEGTYVRTLCEDLARTIGTVGHMGALLRDGAGPFTLADALLPEEIDADPLAALVVPDRVIPIPTVVLDGRGAADFRAGRVVPFPEGSAAKAVFVRDGSRVLVGVGEPLGSLLAPRRVFV